MKNNICLYFHINATNNETFYVGIGHNVRRPYRKSGRSKFWTRVANKYGFIVKIIENNLTWLEACQKEQYYIQLIGRRDLGKGPLVNMSDGGEGQIGFKHSNESKHKISSSQLGHKRNLGKKHSKESIQKMINAKLGNIPWNKGMTGLKSWNKGKKMSIEARLKMSKAKKGKKPWNKGKKGLQKHSEETKKKMSNSHKGKISKIIGLKRSEEFKKKVSKNNAKYWLGKKLPKEHIEKMLKSKRENKFNLVN